MPGINSTSKINFLNICKWYSSDGKVSWQLGGKEYHKVTTVTPQQTAQKTIGGGEPTRGACLCSGEKQEGTEQKAEFIQSFLGGKAFQSGLILNLV